MAKWSPRPLPDWALNLTWFLAAFTAGGLAIDRIGFWIAAPLTTLLVVVAVLGHVWQSRVGAPEQPRRDARYLLELIWRYPTLGTAEASWAVKESKVLQGKIGSAKENPSSGVAIVTTEIALLAFGDEARGRIDGLIEWALERSEPESPYWVLAEQENPIDPLITERKRDLRHTLAFGVVLLRADRERARTAAYVRLALKTQEDDGFWLIPDSTAEGAVLATLYGAELLYLARKHPALSRAERREVERKWTLAVDWLIRSRRPDGLWSTGMLKDQRWEGAVASAWVLHRLFSPPPKLSERWRRCVEDTAEQMIRLVEGSETWLDTSPAQRFRVKARVAGALRRTVSSGSWSKRVEKLMRRYIATWERGDGARLGGLKDDEIDVSTAAFALWGLADAEQIERLGRLILAEEGL